MTDPTQNDAKDLALAAFDTTRTSGCFVQLSGRNDQNHLTTYAVATTDPVRGAPQRCRWSGPAILQKRAATQVRMRVPDLSFLGQGAFHEILLSAYVGDR
ncbi:hypothetical protein MF271_22660 (plasmid) [Deinococcus sp. KNUC1210]|uniref:hypothetical protein n=1 Tax=Deinococcus sp. KNUC1210 TaxID=2917691 RepID=UPI001EEFA60D|nr:hypothetical protein [Deinococcus sp. KNUC1210]ULH18269.1 hypothetical protein MF271_22660 [Deinococcus sp. KNUC1210]